MSLIRCYLVLMCVSLFAISIKGRAADVVNTQVDQWLGHIVLPASNFVENGSFEHGLNGWEIFNGKTVGEVDNKVHYSGAASLRESGTSPQNHYLYQYNLPLETGRTYTLSAMVKTQGLSESMRKQGVVTLANYGWTNSVSLVPDAATMDWKRVSVTFKAMATKPRPDGAPTYNLVIYWAPQTQGTVWIDDIQIEEGENPSAYNETSAQSAIKASDSLRTLATNMLDMREVATHYENHELATQAAANIEILLEAAAGVRDKLQDFSKLSYAEQRSLPDEVTAISGKLARIRTMAWLGPADIPLEDVKPPDVTPDELSLDITCVQGEHRDVALNLANLADHGYAARLAPSVLYDAEHAIETPATQWVQLYSVPRIRGFAQPSHLFTDPLPTLDNAGLIHVEPATVSQVIISLDTSHLLPGTHEGTISFDSLQDSTDHLEVKVKLHILPITLPAFTGVDIADCYGVIDYAWPGIEEVGINTFTVNVSWINADFDEHGNLTNMDFDRVAQQIRDDLAHVKDARFHFLSLGLLTNTLQQQHGWKPHQPEFENAVKQWLQAVVGHMNKLGVSTERLRIETIDEPGPGDLKPAAYLAGLVKATVPEMQTQIYLTGISHDADWQAMAKAHDIITPSVSACTPENMAFLKSLGSRIWIYDAQANGETLNPIAYYRLMPWMARQYGIVGWSQFSWVNTIRGRPYQAWNGVEAQNMVYPSSDGQGAVFSRRLLAMRAGNEDYRILQLLGDLIAAAPASNPQVVQARDFLEHAPEKALTLAPRQPGYQTHLVQNAPQGLLDSLRNEAVEHISSLLNTDVTPRFTVVLRADKSGVIITAPVAGQVDIRYLIDGQLPWGEVNRHMEAGHSEVNLPVESGKISRLLVQFISQDGRISVQNTGIIPQMTADSSAEGYSVRPLNDGIRAISSKFEPSRTWISGSSDSEHWAVAQFPRQQVNNITLYWMTYTGLPRQFMVQYRDGSTDSWKAVSSTPKWIAADAPVQQLHFAPVTSTALRVLVARQGGGTGAPAMVGLSEVEVALLPSTP